jgi:hypothetical protein
VLQADGSRKPMLDGNIIRGDPAGHGIVKYANGVKAYMLNSGRGTDLALGRKLIFLQAAHFVTCSGIHNYKVERPAWE